MRTARACFVLAGVSLLSAASLAFAQTLYEDQYCFSTPVPACFGQCGCDINQLEAHDVCDPSRPAAGQTEVAYEECVDRPTLMCESPANGCEGVVYNCDCLLCQPTNGVCPTCPPGPDTCRTTSKTGCGKSYGCITG